MTQVRAASLAKHINTRIHTPYVDSDIGSKLARHVYYQVTVSEEMFEKDTSVQKISTKLMAVAGAYFIDYMHALAKKNPKAYHHVYEWGDAGNPASRLFGVRINAIKDPRPGARGRLMFLDATKPNNEGYMFKKKAEVFESGEPVTVNPIRSDLLVFPMRRTSPEGNTIFEKDAQGNPKFIYAKQTTIRNPGGTETTGALGKAFRAYWASGVPTKVIKDENTIKILLKQIRGTAKTGSAASTQSKAKKDAQNAVSKATLGAVMDGTVL